MGGFTAPDGLDTGFGAVSDGNGGDTTCEDVDDDDDETPILTCIGEECIELSSQISFSPRKAPWNV